MTGKTPAQRLRDTSRDSARGPHPVHRLIPRPAGLSAQHRVLMAQHQQFGRSRPVAAEQRDDQAGYPTDQRVNDLEQHPPS